jgi:chemotaxis protein MotB
MPKETWIVAAILTVVVIVGLVGFSSCVKQRELEQVKAELAEARAAAAKTDAAVADLSNKLAESQSRAETLQKEKDTTVQAHKSLEDELRSALESKDVTISQLQGKLTVNILDRILFDSGEADLKPGGSIVLRKVADVLTQHPSLKIHVIGHTDNVPIRASARSRFASNWELSTARAAAAVRFLTEVAGVDPRRLGIVGYGEFRPIADNATTEGRAKNRRIAITILSEEMAGSDTIAGLPQLTNQPALLAVAPTNTLPPAPPVTAEGNPTAESSPPEK